MQNSSDRGELIASSDLGARARRVLEGALEFLGAAKGRYESEIMGLPPESGARFCVLKAKADALDEFRRELEGLVAEGEDSAAELEAMQ